MKQIKTDHHYQNERFLRRVYPARSLELVVVEVELDSGGIAVGTALGIKPLPETLGGWNKNDYLMNSSANHKNRKSLFTDHHQFISV